MSGEIGGPGLFFVTDLIYQFRSLVTLMMVVVALDAPPSFGKKPPQKAI